MKRIVTAVLVLVFAMFISVATAQNGEQVLVGNEIGDAIGDFEGKNPDGEYIKLSDLSGKLVMVVLWNSLCNHCVVENQKYIDVFEEYRNKEFVNGDGFDIFMIALDKEEATWHEALEKYQYPWINHVYVIDSWKDPDIRFFGVKNLPGNFLIDGDGIILEKKFGGSELSGILESFVKK
jgi:thiol-disulfide isomerase/thioredoxin